jgi:hypothetical protein
MKVAITLTGLLLAATATAQELRPRPSFHDFPVAKIWKGKPAAPKLVTEDDRMFRTRIRLGAKVSVEFAGHYTMPRWGCGTSCSVLVIVDSITGKVYEGVGATDLPFAWLEEHPAESYERWEFHANSRLLKVNGCPNEENCGFYDYEMVDGKGLRLARRELLPKHYQPECDYGTSQKMECALYSGKR